MTIEIQEFSNARKKLASAYRAVYAIGILCTFFSILILIFGNRIPDYMLLGIVLFLFGILYLVLGFFVQRKSKVALGIAVGIMLLDLLNRIYVITQTGQPFSLIIPIVFFSQTIEGFKAIQVLKSKH